MNSRKEKVAIFVIAYNAESHIEMTLSRIPEDIWRLVEEVFIIDDCSTDDTVQCSIKLMANYPKLHVIRNPMNKRYGGTQKIGFQYAVDKGYDALVILHADGQYAPEILPEMIELSLKSQADVVLGSRMIRKQDALKGGMPKYKFLGNIVLTHIQNFLSNTGLHEFHSGYRVYKVAFLRLVPFWDNTDEWHFDTEILLQGYAASASIIETPIPTYYGNEIKRVNGLVYAINCILTTLRYALYRTGLYYCRNFDVNASGSKYSSKFEDPYSSHSLLYNYLHRRGISGIKVLELGVGDSSLTQRLHEKGAIVDCVELDKNAAQLARNYARYVWHESLENIDLDAIHDQYDIVIAADILEHLVYPEVVLSKLKKCVKKGGELLVSLPNIANIYVRINIMLGRFPYHSKGILDNTHLHFYTLNTAERLIKKTGWVVMGRDYTSVPVVSVFPFLKRRFWIFILRVLHMVTLAGKGLFCYQSLFYCKNPNESDLL